MISHTPQNTRTLQKCKLALEFRYCVCGHPFYELLIIIVSLIELTMTDCVRGYISLFFGLENHFILCIVNTQTTTHVKKLY